MNNTKIYSINGGDDEAIARFCRIVFGGGASARFHRPHPLEGEEDHTKSTEWGLGLSAKAQTVIQGIRVFTDEMEVFHCEPRNDLLSDREENEAYLLAEPGRQYALFFPDYGAVRLDLSDAQGPFEVRWFDISRGDWADDREKIKGGEVVPVQAPGQGPWTVLIQGPSQ